MRPGEFLYESAVRLLIPALHLATPFNDKLRRGVAGRRESLRSLQAWGATSRVPERPLLWMHAPSVGEALMAQAILAGARTQMPDLQSIFTFFSPSAERVATRIGADWHGYLPWDTRSDMIAALDSARPSCVAFVRTEIWPVLVREARQRRIPTLLVNAVLSAGSSRTGAGARVLLGRAYASLHAVGAVSADDAARFALLDVDTTRIHVTGDARFDQVWNRIAQRDPHAQFAKPDRFCVVAGSTWPEDEERLIPAMSPSWCSIIAPHEPDHAHIAALEKRLDAAGLSHARLPADPAIPLPDVSALVVDRVGVLADLYAIADVAYVGGGFGSDGLHSIVEPAALAVPCIYGPRHGNAGEAEELRAAGGGFVVGDRDQLRTQLGRLAASDDTRLTAGRAAAAFVRSRLGAAARTADLIVRSLG